MTATTRLEQPRREGRRLDRRCRGCGYGVAAASRPRLCPMCGGAAWLEVRPAARAGL